ncbi:uncharacterized protein B0J16DRAFT_387347 [Fusarium flagelliforme]|uniref:uncharacterized protein n=1 Tax=Fusarium flagelliforme TaxID=2675880 RepID=UPI001E8E4AC9|nr:uncharacterized protein B0J16DRAFT_387347 [Fusarium flagelliforme]KAH7179517.1 hypothetical protein B0J16DRAFT_387347 [Fusarium flagelliforme]
MKTTTEILKTPPPNMLSYTCAPPETPPAAKTPSWFWKCRLCRSQWKLAVTRRCLKCAKTKTVGGSKMIGLSRSDTWIREDRLDKNRTSRRARKHDYDYWTVHNDWRRFRSVYKADPEAWKRHTDSELFKLKGKERRVMKVQIEKSRRTEMTQQRLERMLKNTHNCDIDCDYPSQCHSERYEADLQEYDDVILRNMVMKIPNPADDGYSIGKLPLCGLVPDFVRLSPKTTDAEDLDSEDETLVAYEDQQEDWFATSPRSPVSSDEEEEVTEQGPDDEADEKQDKKWWDLYYEDFF